jgi:curli biogenesis system outer membrane secretion channel CsgG
MKTQSLLIALTLALAAVSGVAQADSKPVPYRYGMPMDVQKVISMSEPQTNECKVIKADIKFLDKSGAEQNVSYKKLSDACMSQN